MKRGRIISYTHQHRSSFFSSQSRYFKQKNLLFCLFGALLCAISQFRTLPRSHGDSHNPPIDSHRYDPENNTAEGLVSSGTASLGGQSQTLAERGPIPASINTRPRTAVNHDEGPAPSNSTNTSSSTTSTPASYPTLPQGQEPQQPQQQAIVKNAIVHIGPYKTGSSTIQEYSNALRIPLKQDGYEMPYSHQFSNGTSISNPWSNQVNFATCFYHNAKPSRIAERDVYPCRNDLLESGLDIGQQNHGNSIFLSAESFSALEEEGIAALRDYLHPTWNNITIIAYYRRYYDWILSFHNEVSRTIMTKDPWRVFENNATDLLGASIVNDLTSNIDLLEDMHHKYTLTVIQRYRKYFSNIVVVNMHEKRNMGFLEHFYCVLIPHGENTCAALRHMLSNQAQLEANRSSQNIAYLELAYAAHRKGMFHIQTKEHCAHVAVAMKGYQEKVLNRTVADFPRRCLPSDVLDRMWNTSVQAEKEFRNQHVSAGGAASGNSDGDDHDDGGVAPPLLAAQRDDFEKLSKSRLCEVDFDAILGTLAWREFFEKHVPMHDSATNSTVFRNKDLVGTASKYLWPE